LAKNYANGAVFERFIKKAYESQGFFVIRSAGSKSPVDLIAWKVLEEDGEEEVHVIQCKKANTKQSYKDDVTKLRGVSVPENWLKILYVKFDRKVIVSIIREDGCDELNEISLKDLKRSLE